MLITKTSWEISKNNESLSETLGHNYLVKDTFSDTPVTCMVNATAGSRAGVTTTSMANPTAGVNPNVNTTEGVDQRQIVGIWSVGGVGETGAGVEGTGAGVEGTDVGVEGTGARGCRLNGGTWTQDCPSTNCNAIQTSYYIFFTFFFFFFRSSKS